MKVPGSLPVLTALVCAAASLLLTAPTQAQQTPSTQAQLMTFWRNSMKKVPFPKNGCFKAVFPNTVWQEEACAAPPTTHTIPPNGTDPETVGNGYDFTASVSGTLAWATGSFLGAAGLQTANTYSLQVNTNLFHTSSCNGAVNPSQCYGWVQFVFDQSSWHLFLEYTLINFGSTNCPSGWSHYSLGSEINCFINTPARSVPSQPLAYLPYMSLEGQVSGSQNTAMLSSPGGFISAVVQNGLFGGELAQYWNQAEFNVFGNNNGNQVNFNSGTSFVVETTVSNGTQNAPQCVGPYGGGTTGETNNLNLVPQSLPVCCPVSGYSPSIQFMETNASGVTASCSPSGLQTNIPKTATPTDTLTWTIYGGTYYHYHDTLYDSTPGATIYYSWTCGSNSGGGQTTSGGGFDVVASGGCGLSGPRYATAPGYMQSSLVNGLY